MRMNDQAIVDFFYEVGHFKRLPRAGWQIIGIKAPETVAEHTCRSVFMAYVLAKMEGANPEKAALISAIHELPETRLGDLSKVAQKYIPEKKERELIVLKDQLKDLPEEIRKGFWEFLEDFEKDTTPEQVVARDADYLEVLMQAKEYLLQGCEGAQNWIDNASKLVKTESAKRLVPLIINTRPSAWAERNKRIKR